MKKLLCTALVFCAMFKGQTQDINFSQFYELPLLRNPALAGIYKGDYRFTSVYRNQWASVTTPYKTLALGFETRLPIPNSNDYVSLGSQVTHDQAGDSKLSKTQLLPLLAYHKSLDTEKDAYLTIGLLAGAVQQRFDPSALRFSDQFVGGAYSESNPTQQSFQSFTRIYWDNAIGLAYSSIVGEDLRFYLGAGLFHFTQPKVAFTESDIRLNRKYVFNAGVSGPVANSGRIIIYYDVFVQGGNNQMQGGLLYQRFLGNTEEENPTTLAIGSTYRLNDAIVPVIRLDYGRVSAGFSYDVNISKLSKASHGSGGVEFTLSFKGIFKNNSATSRLRCPVNFN